MHNNAIYGFLKYSPKKIWNYLQNDLDDDWFQDPIRYADFKILKADSEFFESNIRKNFGRYQSEEKEIFHLPKGNFTLRYSLETNFYDRFMYICLVLPLMEMFDSQLDPRVYNHRYCGDNRYLFLHPVNQWEKFEGIVRSEATDKLVLVTDIQNYFENIQLELLKEDLEKCLLKANVETNVLVETRFIIDRLMECLDKWSYDGKRGLPQNRDCSSFLANIYLKSIDEKMIADGFEYYRYMDDIRIVCDDKFRARRALKELVNLLRDKHLSVNGKKTDFIHPGIPKHNDILRPKTELKKIDSLLNTKKKANVAIGYSILKEKCMTLIKEKKFEEREFRFCINRLSKLARCKEYKVPQEFWNDITEEIIHAIIECPTSTDRIYDFIASVGMNEKTANIIVEYLYNPNACIYEWQNYWLWKLLIICNIKNDQMTIRARNILQEHSQIPNNAGAILYLSKFGDKSDKQNIMNSISKADSIFLQRHKWLASKGLDWIADKVQEKKDEIHECDPCCQ